MPSKIDPAVKARALRMVEEHRKDHSSDTALALIVDESLTIAELAATLCEDTRRLCEPERLFDLCTGPEVGEGTKWLAFALRFPRPHP